MVQFIDDPHQKVSQTDRYSRVGCVMYDIVTGRHPCHEFEASNDRSHPCRTKYIKETNHESTMVPTCKRRMEHYCQCSQKAATRSVEVSARKKFGSPGRGPTASAQRMDTSGQQVQRWRIRRNSVFCKSGDLVNFVRFDWPCLSQ
jgi:hypothetical protein